MRTPASLTAAIDALRALPAGTSLEAHALAEWLAPITDTNVATTCNQTETPDACPSWRERLWVAPAETRIGRVELLEALGRSPSWLYKRTSGMACERAGVPRLPHRKLDGELVFVVGEIRAWIRSNEDVQESGPMESAAWERTPHLRAS